MAYFRRILAETIIDAEMYAGFSNDLGIMDFPISHYKLFKNRKVTGMLICHHKKTEKKSRNKTKIRKTTEKILLPSSLTPRGKKCYRVRNHKQKFIDILKISVL